MTIENIYAITQLHVSNVQSSIVVENIYTTAGGVYVENISGDIAIDNLFTSQSIYVDFVNSGIVLENIFHVTQVFIEDVQTTTIGGNGGTPTDISHIEAELQISGTNARYVEYTYSGSVLVAKDVYTDDTKTVQIYGVDYTYTGEDLTGALVTRISDGYQYTKTFTYTSGNLISINYEQI